MTDHTLALIEQQKEDVYQHSLGHDTLACEESGLAPRDCHCGCYQQRLDAITDLRRAKAETMLAPLGEREKEQRLRVLDRDIRWNERWT